MQAQIHNDAALVRSIRAYLRSVGYYRKQNGATAERIFRKHLDYYLRGDHSLTFLSTLADELLFCHFKKVKSKLNKRLFQVLMAASRLSAASTPEELTRLNSLLGDYLLQNDMEGIPPKTS